MFRRSSNKIKADLPANAEMTYLPAAFRPDEDWPMFQRAFFAAQALGIVDKTHDAMFDAVWKDDGSLQHQRSGHERVRASRCRRSRTSRSSTRQYGVKAEDFVGTANSFAVNTKMKRADAQIKAYGVDSTPTIIVNGKYRVTATSRPAASTRCRALVLYLVDQESQQVSTRHHDRNLRDRGAVCADSSLEEDIMLTRLGFLLAGLVAMLAAVAADARADTRPPPPRTGWKARTIS